MYTPPVVGDDITPEQRVADLRDSARRCRESAEVAERESGPRHDEQVKRLTAAAEMFEHQADVLEAETARQRAAATPERGDLLRYARDVAELSKDHDGDDAADTLRSVIGQARVLLGEEGETGDQSAAIPAGSTEASRTRRVRRTVDLSSDQHDQLTVWCNETAWQLGQARVTGQDVLRALVAHLLADEEFAATIRANLADPR